MLNRFSTRLQIAGGFYLCKTWFLLLPQEHFFVIELYLCQQ